MYFSDSAAAWNDAEQTLCFMLTHVSFTHDETKTNFESIRVASTHGLRAMSEGAMSVSSEALMTGRGIEWALQEALDVLGVRSRMSVILNSSDGEEAAENVQRHWRKCVLASKYLQLKRELAVSQHKAKPAVPSKGRANDRAKLLRQLMLDWRQYYGDCDATDAETEASMRETSEQWPDVTEIDLAISGQQRDITPAMGMQTTCFTEHREGKLPIRLTVAALRRRLQHPILAEALAGDAEKADQQLGKMRSLSRLVRRRQREEGLLLLYNGMEAEAKPKSKFPDNMMLLHFSHEELLKFPKKILTAENQGLSAENQGLKVLFWSASALVMALAVCLYFKTVAEVPI